MKEQIIDYVIKELGITQKELATRIKVNPAVISNWKKGKEYIPFDRHAELCGLVGTQKIL